MSATDDSFSESDSGDFVTNNQQSADDDEFDFASDDDALKNTNFTRSQKVSDQHYDEAVELSGSDFDDSILANQDGQFEEGRTDQPVDFDDSADYANAAQRQNAAAMEQNYSNPAMRKNAEALQGGSAAEPRSFDASSSDDEERMQARKPRGQQLASAVQESGADQQDATAANDDETPDGEIPSAGAACIPQDSEYNPEDYAHLDVSSEIKGLFDYIDRYKPHSIELDTPLKPFLPDYLPAVGEIDNFVKIPRPDGKPDMLGLTVLSEPSGEQSDPAVLRLLLDQLNKTVPSGKKHTQFVNSIERADKNPQKVTAWINNIEELHRGRPPPSVTFSKPMPTIDDLMQVWPEQMEAFIAQNPDAVPSADIDLTLEEYARAACSLLDIPVHNNIIHSLHHLFTLLAEFKANDFHQNTTDPFHGQSAAEADLDSSMYQF